MNDISLLCGSCGYDLRGAVSDRCPQCGRRFDRDHLIAKLIPWEQRRFIGRTRAYLRTVRLVCFRPSLVAEKVAMPVSVRAARRFRAVTMAVMFVTVAACA